VNRLISWRQPVYCGVCGIGVGGRGTVVVVDVVVVVV
jgi:hypothetical protein